MWGQNHSVNLKGGGSLYQEQAPPFVALLVPPKAGAQGPQEAHWTHGDTPTPAYAGGLLSAAHIAPRLLAAG